MFTASKLPRGLLVALTALAVFLLAFGAWKIVEEILFAARAETALGTVLDFSGGRATVRFVVEKKRDDQPGGTTDRRLVGQINMYQGVLEAARIPALSRDEEVEVLYRPENPREARIAGLWQRYSSPGIAILAGALLGALVIPSWRRRASSQPATMAKPRPKPTRKKKKR